MLGDNRQTIFSMGLTLVIVLLIVMLAIQVYTALSCLLTSAEYVHITEIGPFRTAWECH